MKRVILRLFFAVTGLLVCCRPASGNEPPKGFEEPLLASILAGEIAKQQLISNELETKVVLRAYCSKIETDDYIATALDHENYSEIFPEIQEARTLRAEENGGSMVLDWTIDLIVQPDYLPIPIHVNPTGTQTATRAKDALGIALIENRITNYRKDIEKGTQSTRLIPYGSGFLVEDTIHVKMKYAGVQAKFIRSKIMDQFMRFLSGFRKASGGESR